MEFEKTNVYYVRSILKRIIASEVAGHVDELSDANDVLQRVLCVCANLARLLDGDTADIWEEAVKEVETDMKEVESEWSL